MRMTSKNVVLLVTLGAETLTTLALVTGFLLPRWRIWLPDRKHVPG